MSAETTTIKFYLGDESRLVIDDFQSKNESIFKDAYGVALNIISDYIGNRKKTYRNNMSAEFFRQTSDAIDNNIVAFVGDRGTGKSSCMLSVANMLKSVCGDGNGCDLPESLKKCENGFEILETIDPSFFEEKTNILEIVLGRMFSNFKRLCKIGNVSNRGDYEEEKNALFKAFQEVKESLVQKNGCEIGEEDYVDSLLKLTASVDLRDSFKNLIDCYLKFIKKDYFVIAVDDLDLNTEYAYQMAEQIRKYLRQENVLVLIALKLDQLEKAVQLEFEKQYQLLVNKRQLDCQDMVAKYIGKLIPEKNRVVLPTVDVWVDSIIRILKKSEKDGIWIDYDERHNNQTLKYYVVSLIFQKTRYLFYHTEGKISPIVPKNLRELRQLIGALCAMPDYTSETKFENNKEVFKEYFLKTWIPNRLNSECVSFMQDLFKMSASSDINKKVIARLKNYVAKNLLVKRDLEETNDAETEISRVIDDGNASFNISLGDVLLVVSYLKNRLESNNDKMMLFAIETFYSMRLYEYYDLKTEKTEYDRRSKLNANIDYTIKRKDVLDGVDAYDILVGGSFVNTNAVEILSRTRGKYRRDIRTILRGPIDRLIDSIENEGDLGGHKLRWAEFFVLFISRRISDPKRFGGSEKYWRKRDEVSYIAPLNTARLMFDVFSIFYNILDIEQQYKRFSEKLYNLATDKNANSLFNAIKDYCYNERKLRSNPPDVEWDRRWNLLSWGAIRNIDVLESVVESAKSLGKGYSGENIEHILAYLRNISAFEIKTYDITTNNDRYTITFKFLGIIKDFIDEERKNGSIEIFNEIYSSYLEDTDVYDVEEVGDNDYETDVSLKPRMLNIPILNKDALNYFLDDEDLKKMLRKKTSEGIRRFILEKNPVFKGNSLFKRFWTSIQPIEIPKDGKSAYLLYTRILNAYMSYNEQK